MGLEENVAHCDECNEWHEIDSDNEFIDCEADMSRDHLRAEADYRRETM